MASSNVCIRDAGQTTDDIARLFGRSKQTIFLWRKNKGLPFVEIRGANRSTIRFQLADVKKWAKANKIAIQE